MNHYSNNHSNHVMILWKYCAFFDLCLLHNVGIGYYRRDLSQSSKNKRASLLYYVKLSPSFQSHWWIKTWVPVRKRLIQVEISNFCPVWPSNLTDDLEKNRTPPLCCFKLCASFHSHQCIQTGVTVQKLPIWVKFNDFFCHVTLKFYRWPWKTKRHLS